MRISKIKINGKILETPFLFPVLAFFCGGNEKSYLGGGIYRHIKEKFLTNEKFRRYFFGVMTSIAQLNDFNITKKKLEKYTSKTIHEWFNFNGILFVDSGGYKLLTNGKIKGKDFEIRTAEEVLYYQLKFGADILVSLDYPISPNLPKNEIEKRIKFSINNAIFLLENKPKKTLTYIAVHGYSQKDLKLYMERLLNGLEKSNVSLKKIDGIALGSLVPIRRDSLKILEIVRACKEVLHEFSLDVLPLHIFGISGTLMPLLILMGADTFDSGTYLHLGIEGIYLKKGLKRVERKKISKNLCNCEICSNKNYFSLIKNSERIDSLVASLIAMHNLVVFNEELQLIKEIVKDYDENRLIKFIQNRYSHSKVIRKSITYLMKK
ncbi:MAG: tRNA-guanine transglycosylase [Candidatus Aenigmatarchaeota archaeon]